MAEKVPTSTTTVTDSQGVNAVGNVSAGGDVNITQNNTVQSGRVQMIQTRTTKRIKVWTEGMVVTAGLTKLMEKIHSGVTWVTVKGQPGEGKTTAAYMALRALQESGRQVFQVLSPEEFTEVATTFPDSVILLDDLFGQVVFDPTAWSRWKQVIVDNLGEKEHVSHGETSKETVTVIFVGRNYVLDNVIHEIGKLSRFFSDDNYMVYMSKSGERKLDEKVAILKAICDSKGMELNIETRQTICNADGPHGFPHTCQLFVTLTKDGIEIDTVKFMESPLQFLNQTVEAFLENTKKLLLFKEMIKRDGKINVSEIGNLDSTYAVQALVDSLLDSYLRKEEDCFTFHHPSIFDCISFNLLKHDPLFVIKYCSVSFLRERLRLQSRDTHQANSESNLVVNIPRLHLRILAKRFVKEILKRNLVHVLSHPAVTDEQFVKELMSHIWLPRIRLPFFTDRNTGDSFLSLIASSKSPQILKYLENQRLGKLSESRLKSVLYGVYQYGAIDVLTYVEQSRDTLDINVRYVNDLTPLKIACEFNQVEMVKLLLTRGASWDEKTLIEACRSGSLDVVKFLFERGATVDMTADRYTPLTAACMSGSLDVVKFLFERGATVDMTTGWYTPLTAACMSGSLDVVKFLFERGATVDMTADRYSPLTAASRGGHVNVMRFLVGEGGSVNTADRWGWYPLHSACVGNNPQAVQWLLDQGADRNSGDREAYTPLHVAAGRGSKDCVVALVNAGASVNVQDTHSRTPLHEAAASGYKDCVVALVNAGASVNVQDTYGDTPLDLATLNQHKQCVDVLQKAGAVTN